MLEAGLTLDPRHAGLCHLYVHACEMGPRTLLRNPQLAAARDCIRGGVIPDSGHLIHMASHIDVQLGEYLLRSNACAYACANGSFTYP